MQTAGSFLLIAGFTCLLGRFLLDYLGDATVTFTDRLQFVGLRLAGFGLVLWGVGLVVG